MNRVNPSMSGPAITRGLVSSLAQFGKRHGNEGSLNGCSQSVCRLDMSYSMQVQYVKPVLIGTPSKWNVRHVCRRPQHSRD